MLTSWLSPLVLICVVVVILRRPWQINEAIPAAAGAVVLVALGIVTVQDLEVVLHVVSGAGLTILATILMSAVLDRAGFFRWAAVQMVRKARGSGKRLFVLTLLLCFCMTMFFNNDGSILITTPIILEMMHRLGFTKAQSLPFLLGGCLVATSASAPIGVSNLANLIALSIVGLDLNQYAALMLVPSLLGILVCALLLYAVFRRQIPRHYELQQAPVPVFPPRPGDTWHLPKPVGTRPHPAMPKAIEPGRKGSISKPGPPRPEFDSFLCTVGIGIVVLVRVGFFIGAAYGVPVQVIAIIGASVLLMIYRIRRPKGVWPIVETAPWHILVFAFGMYTLIYALHKQGFTLLLGHLLQVLAGHSLFVIVIMTGVLLTVMSCLFNNLPSVMIGTVMLTDLHLSPVALKLTYLANVLGSDIGSLLLPMGTLASLLWFHLVRRRTGVTWTDYIRVSWVVIPPSLLVSLFTLYVWGGWLLR